MTGIDKAIYNRLLAKFDQEIADHFLDLRDKGLTLMRIVMSLAAMEREQSLTDTVQMIGSRHELPSTQIILALRDARERPDVNENQKRLAKALFETFNEFKKLQKPLEATDANKHEC
jgi:dTDP-4-amino-4,6-dideoxygalactose transaminase